MIDTVAQPQDIDIAFTAPIVRDETKGGWTIVVMPRSGEILGTRRPVKVAGTMDGQPFAATLLPMGDGTHMVPVKAALRKAIGKDSGAEVTVRLEQRFG